MIIWGRRALTSTVFRGTSYCPECSQQRAYSRRRMRRFFTLYFIPLFPTKTLGEYDPMRCLQERVPGQDSRLPASSDARARSRRRVT